MANKNSNKTVKEKKIVNQRAKSLKIFSISSVILVLAIVLVLNILLSMTLDGALTFDMTESSKNSISKQTQEYIDSIPSDTKVRIVGLMDRPEDYEGTPYEYFVPMLDDMASKSSGKISVEYYNPDVYPQIMKELDPNGLANLSKELYCVKSGDKIRTVDPYDCFFFDVEYQQMGAYIPTANNSESVFVNTIVSVTSQSNYKVYYLVDIQEQPHTYLDSIFASMNVETDEISALVEPFVVPDDCSLLIINNPGTDISEGTQEGLKAYIHNGKNPVNIICSLGITESNINSDFAHINNVLNEVGLSVDSSCIIENSDRRISSDGYNFIASICDEYKSYIPSSSVMISTFCRPVVETNRAYSNIVSSPMFMASSDNELLRLETENDVIVEASNSVVGAHGYYDGTQNPVDVYVFGTGALTADSYLMNETYATNQGVIKDILDDIFITETRIDIPAKILDDYTMKDITNITASTRSTVAVVFIAVIPIVFVIIAAVVYNRRSHL